MAYADKCFYFDWGEREIELKDFGLYDKVSLRSRWLPDDPVWEHETNNISIELWGKEKEDGTREKDSEIVLSRDNAMLLATKLMRAVHELDTTDQLANLYEDVDILKEIHSNFQEDNTFQVERDRRYDNGWLFDRNKKHRGILANHLNTPRGQDNLKKMNNGRAV